METILKDGRKVKHLSEAETNAFVNEDLALKDAYNLTPKKDKDKDKFNADFLKMLNKYSTISKNKI